MSVEESRRRNSLFQALKVYKFLGFLTLAQTALSLTLWLVSAVESERSKGRRKSSGTGTDGSVKEGSVQDDDVGLDVMPFSKVLSS